MEGPRALPCLALPCPCLLCLLALLTWGEKIEPREENEGIYTFSGAVALRNNFITVKLSRSQNVISKSSKISKKPQMIEVTTQDHRYKKATTEISHYFKDPDHDVWGKEKKKSEAAATFYRPSISMAESHRR